MPARPDASRARDLALVGAGGAAGTIVRYGLGLAAPPVAGVPVATVVVNLVGAFLLGLLLERLRLAGPDAGRRRDLRLLLGTGVLGGFTTYSALALDTADLLGGDRGWLAAGYALGTVVLGVLAAAAGLRCARSGTP